MFLTMPKEPRQVQSMREAWETIAKSLATRENRLSLSFSQQNFACVDTALVTEVTFQFPTLIKPETCVGASRLF